MTDHLWTRQAIHGIVPGLVAWNALKVKTTKRLIYVSEKSLAAVLSRALVPFFQPVDVAIKIILF